MAGGMIVIRLWCALSLVTLAWAATAIAWAWVAFVMPAAFRPAENPTNGPPFMMPLTR